jgi:hypothetical protein
MKVRWYIQGAGCDFQQCGLIKGRTITIDETELPDDQMRRKKMIDDIVQEEFDRQVYPIWDCG